MVETVIQKGGKVKMEWLIYVIVTIAIGLGSFIGGERVQAIHDEKLPPKYQTTYNIQDVKSKTEVVVRSEQGQTTIMVNVQGQTNAKFFNWQVNAHTNISFSRSVMTNKMAKTNAEKLLKSLNLPPIPSFSPK